MITDTPNPIIKWFDELWNQMQSINKVVFSYHCREEIFYIEDISLEWILYVDYDTNVFRFNNPEFWEILKRINIGYSDIEPVVRFLWIENKLNLITNPLYIDNSTNEYIDGVMKRYEAELNHYKIIK